MKQVIVTIFMVALGLALGAALLNLKTGVNTKMTAVNSQIENITTSCVYEPSSMPSQVYYG